MPGGAEAWRLADGRLHLLHGPIDLIVEAFGDPAAVEQAYRRAEAGFQGLLDGLVAEIEVLKTPLASAPAALPPAVEGVVARRMVRAAWPWRKLYVTPMAAVAGAIADEVLEAINRADEVLEAINRVDEVLEAAAGSERGAGASREGALERVYVNNRGDIAFHLEAGQSFSTGVIPDPRSPEQQTRIVLPGHSPVRGLATSGWRGRSWSLGIADAVAAFAPRAAEADVAATLIANAVNVEHPAVERRPAGEVFEDGDLGDLPVTVTVGELPPEAVAAALDAGNAVAEQALREGLITGALLFLAGSVRAVGFVGETPESA